MADGNPINCRVLSEEAIRRRQEDFTAKTASKLSISKPEATILLHHFNWNVTNAKKEFSVNQNRVRNSLGLFNKQLTGMNAGRWISCGICFDSYPRYKTTTLSCGHPFCNDCWRSYIVTAISDQGPGCLTLRCPARLCHAAVGQDMVEKLAPTEANKKYRDYLVRSFVENKERVKWCPAPGCDLAVEIPDVSPENYDVSCWCKHSFCWNCSEEPHRPVDCQTVEKWILKNSSESGTANWILAKTKPCRNCSNAIEKNSGCSHMICRCGYQFCWDCLCSWTNHIPCKQTGRAYYDQKVIREKGKKSLDRYIHYYERWTGNESSRQKAATSLREMEHQQMKVLSFKYMVTAKELGFLTEAWRQIIDGRRVLKWMIVHEYFRSPELLVKEKRELLEFSQREAETGLEQLQDCVHTKLLDFVNQKDSSLKEFNEFSKMVKFLTKSSRDHFRKMIRTVEIGESDKFLCWGGGRRSRSRNGSIKQ